MHLLAIGELYRKEKGGVSILDKIVHGFSRAVPARCGRELRFWGRFEEEYANTWHILALILQLKEGLTKDLFVR